MRITTTVLVFLALLVGAPAADAASGYFTNDAAVRRVVREACRASRGAKSDRERYDRTLKHLYKIKKRASLAGVGGPAGVAGTTPDGLPVRSRNLEADRVAANEVIAVLMPRGRRTSVDRVARHVQPIFRAADRNRADLDAIMASFAVGGANDIGAIGAPVVPVVRPPPTIIGGGGDGTPSANPPPATGPSTVRPRPAADTSIIHFPDTVALGSDTRFFCSGVLVRPRVVVTAAHCWREGIPTRVFIGKEVPPDGSNDPGKDGEIIRVKARYRHQNGMGSDIAVLILERKSEKFPDVPMRAIADPSLLGQSLKTVVAGYGRTEHQQFGRRNYAAVPINGICQSGEGQCVPDLEMIASSSTGARDSCNGDSGGSAYVFPAADINQKPQIVAITSRPVSGIDGECGMGGIYVLIKPHVPYFEKLAPSAWRELDGVDGAN